MITIEEWVMIKHMHNQGVPKTSIAAELGLDPKTVRKAIEGDDHLKVKGNPGVPFLIQTDEVLQSGTAAFQPGLCITHGIYRKCVVGRKGLKLGSRIPVIIVLGSTINTGQVCTTFGVSLVLMWVHFKAHDLYFEFPKS